MKELGKGIKRRSLWSSIVEEVEGRKSGLTIRLGTGRAFYSKGSKGCRLYACLIEIVQWSEQENRVPSPTFCLAGHRQHPPKNAAKIEMISLEKNISCLVYPWLG